MSLAWGSTTGRRDANDDVVVGVDGLVLLADGMGGHAGGRQAAQAAVGAAFGGLHELTERSLRDAFARANEAVGAYRLTAPEHSDAGCTLTIVGVREVPVIGKQAVVGHAGDSPAFLLRRSDMTLLTPPHSVAESMRQAGQLTKEQAASHPSKHTLNRSVGGAPGLAPDITHVGLQEGDRVLVCSDGLLDVPDRRAIRDIACSGKPLDEVVSELIARALEDSHDNITVAVIDPFGEDGWVSASNG